MLASIAHTSLAIQCFSKEPPTEPAAERSHLVRLHVQLRILRQDQPDFMPLFSQCAGRFEIFAKSNSINMLNLPSI